MDAVGWQVAFVLFGVLQAVALLLLGLIFSHLKAIDRQVTGLNTRVAHIEGRLKLGAVET